MRYCLAVLMLFATPPVMNVLAAPAPAPSAILDIGPPPKGQTAEEHRKMQIDNLTYPHGFFVLGAWHDPEVSKLPSVAALKDPRYWFSRNLHVKWEGEGNRLRLTFGAGNRTEQVVILNVLLRSYLQTRKECIKRFEESIRIREEGEPQFAKLLKEERDVNNLRRWLKQAEDAKVQAAEYRAEIARLKQTAAVKWAK